MSGAAAEKQRQVTIVGAGIVGTVVARFVQQAGFAVRLIDADAPGHGCSYGNGGAISPDFCVPIAVPGMLRRVPGWLLDAEGPLVLRWSYLPRAVPWLLRWARASRMDRVRVHAGAMRSLHLAALEDYRVLLGSKAAGLIEVTGQAHVFRAEHPGKSDRLAQEIRDAFGVRAEVLDSEDLRRLDPNLAPIYRSGLFFPINGHTTNPLRLVETVAAKVLGDGGELVRARVREIELGSDGPAALLTDSGRLPVDILVIAAGIGSPALARRLGDRVPVISERGYHVMLPDPGVRPPIKISDRDRMFGFTPMENGLRISGTAELADCEAPMSEKRARALLRHAKQAYPALRDEGAEFWMGCRPSTPDSVPVIGRSTRHRNAYYAFGHGHFGLTGAPMTGRLIADMLAGRPPAIDPKPYRPQRFLAA